MTPSISAEDPLPRDDARYQAALAFLYDRIDYEKLATGQAKYPFRLDRMRDLLTRMDLGKFLYDDDAPDRRPTVPLVHIAGTKGKGSTAAMVAACMTESGRKVGLYTSPHLHELEERFRIDGLPCRREEVIAAVDRLRPVTQRMIADGGGSPSFFELTTAVALWHFDTQACDAIVLEVGLGGRLDSTNVVHPSITAITSIGLDHQHVLGDTRAKIAAEKAGIIKPGIPVISGVFDDEAGPVIRDIAASRGAPIIERQTDFDSMCTPDEAWGSRVSFVGKPSLVGSPLQVHLSLEGRHQADNAALAIAILRQSPGGIEVGNVDIIAAMDKLQFAGRVERFTLARDVTAIVDAAHNADSIAALCQCVAARSAGRDVAVVFGTSIDKTVPPMLERLATVADRIWLTRFRGNPRFCAPESLVGLLPAGLAERYQVDDDPIQACQAALASIGPGGMLVVCGSFFLAAETRGWIAAQTC